MKNITLSADEQLIEQARLLAKSQHKTLNAMFREWLEQFTARSGGTQEFDALMKRLQHVQAGRRFSRDARGQARRAQWTVTDRVSSFWCAQHLLTDPGASSPKVDETPHE